MKKKRSYKPIEGFFHGTVYWFITYTIFSLLLVWVQVIRMSDLVYTFGFGISSVFIFLISMYVVFKRERETNTSKEILNG